MLRLLLLRGADDPVSEAESRGDGACGFVVVDLRFGFLDVDPSAVVSLFLLVFPVVGLLVVVDGPAPGDARGRGGLNGRRRRFCGC